MFIVKLLCPAPRSFVYQGDAAANEKHRGGKTTKTQVPAVDSFAIPTSLAISKNFKDFFFSVPQSLFFVKFAHKWNY